MQLFLSELLDISNQQKLNNLFITEDIGKLKDLGLGRMINAFKQSFSLAGHGSTARLNQTSVGGKLQARATDIGSNSQVLDGGHVRNWPYIRREIIKHLVTPGVSALLFRIDEKPVSLLILGPQWSINNTRAVVGMAWDFTNVSAADAEIQAVLSMLSVKRKSSKEKDEKEGKKEEIPLRMYQGHAQEMVQAIEFIKKGVEAFGNRFNFSIITPAEDEAAKKPTDKRAVKEAKVSITEKYQGDWAILPATMALYNKRTVDIITAGSQWKENVILVCTNESGRICFVSSSGGYDSYAKNVGKSYSTFHDQTGGSKGRYTIKNVVHLVDGEIKDSVNEIGLKDKASLAVFK